MAKPKKPITFETINDFKKTRKELVEELRALRPQLEKVKHSRPTGDEAIERKKAEEEIANLAKFPSENPYPVLRISADGTILYSNKAASPLLKVWKCRQGRRIS
ncbi:MAG TPA: hypothetical protein ENH82_03690, partial [bacterium]|nr:hypothetical protein [bacterium]